MANQIRLAISHTPSVHPCRTSASVGKFPRMVTTNPNASKPGTNTAVARKTATSLTLTNFDAVGAKRRITAAATIASTLL